MYDDLPDTRPARDHAEELSALAARLRRIARTAQQPWYAHASPVAAAMTGAVAVVLASCADADGMLPLAGSIPGVLAALGIALRAQARIRVADAERERIATEAHAAAVEQLAETIRGLRADLDTAQAAVTSALSRERDCERRVRELDARCDALAAEHAELRRAITAGHGRGGIA